VFGAWTFRWCVSNAAASDSLAPPVADLVHAGYGQAARLSKFLAADALLESLAD